MQSPKTWILIADAAQARVLETTGVGHRLVAVPQMQLTTELPRSRDVLTERPPRVQESTGHARHAIEPRTDPHREAKRSFASHVSEQLEAQAQADAFSRLVIVAPPVMLGDLRACIGKATAQRVTAEVARDLVKTPDHEIRGHLGDVVGI